jgi:hypothetical protein
MRHKPNRKIQCALSGGNAMSMLAIVHKDIEQNAKPLLLITVIGISISYFLMLSMRQDSRQSGIEGFLVGSLVLGMPLMFSMWLVGQEKAKGTILILKALPIGGVRVMVAKWLTASAFTLLATLVIEEILPLFIGGMHGTVHHETLSHCVWIVSLSMMTNGLFFSIFTVLDQKLASQLSWIGMSALVFLLGKIASLPAVQHFAKESSGQFFVHTFLICGWILAALMGFICVVFAGRYIDQNDLDELREF